MHMAQSGNMRLLLGVGIGFALAGAARQFAPAFRGLGRPLAKAAIKGTLSLFDQGRLQVAELRETIEDLTAEARAELATEAIRQPPATGEGTGSDYGVKSAYQA